MKIKLIIVILLMLNLVIISYFYFDSTKMEKDNTFNFNLENDYFAKSQFSNIPFFRSEYDKILSTDSLFNVPFEINDANIYFEEMLIQYLAINNISFDCEFGSEIYRFQTISLNVGMAQFIEFPYCFNGRNEIFQCLIILKHPKNRAIYLLWQNKSDSSSDNKLSEPYKIDENTEDLFTSLPKKYIDKLYPRFQGNYHNIELKKIVFELHYEQGYYGKEKFTFMFDYTYPQFYKGFNLVFP